LRTGSSEPACACKAADRACKAADDDDHVGCFAFVVKPTTTLVVPEAAGARLPWPVTAARRPVWPVQSGAPTSSSSVLRAALHWPPAPPSFPQVREAFAAADADHNGSLDAAEVVTVLHCSCSALLHITT